MKIFLLKNYGFDFQLIAVIFCFIFHPIISLIILLFAQIYFIFISLINFIACLGGVPQNDTCFVWQVPGPEIHLDIYYNISNKDIISLVRGYLEKITMNIFQNKIKNMLSYFLFILI